MMLRCQLSAGHKGKLIGYDDISNQLNRRNSIKYNIKHMSEIDSKLNGGWKTLLDFPKDFSYINILQNENSNEGKKSALNVQSHISKLKLLKSNLQKHRKVKRLGIPKSELRKKSKTPSRSQSKKKNIDKQLNYQSNKRQYKIIQPKTSDFKINSCKVLKPKISKKNEKEQMAKLAKNPIRNKKTKDLKNTLFPKLSKTEKNIKRKSNSKKQKTSKSQEKFQKISVSQIRKMPIVGPEQSKIIHQYFGMDVKLSSILLQKHRHKRDKSKLSKCKTQSSRSSISTKSRSTFQYKIDKNKR